jgi:hypothetical protein
LKLDDSCISNPKSEIVNWTGWDGVQSHISDFGFEMQESSNFEIHLTLFIHLSIGPVTESSAVFGEKTNDTWL